MEDKPFAESRTELHSVHEIKESAKHETNDLLPREAEDTHLERTGVLVGNR